MLEQHDLLDVDVVPAGAGATQEPHETARAGLVGLTAWKRYLEPKMATAWRSITITFPSTKK